MSVTIKLQEETKKALDKLKIIDREPYDSVIQRLLKIQSRTLVRNPDP